MVRLRDGGDVDSLDRLLCGRRHPGSASLPASKCCVPGRWPRSRAHRPKSRVPLPGRGAFVDAGLTVSVTPALNVRTLVHDSRVIPACGEHVT